MKTPIVTNDLLQCDKGTKESSLIVTGQKFCLIENKPIATEADHQAEVNIKPFGKCRLKPSKGSFLSCVPIPLKWKNTSTFEITGKKKLLITSYCPCQTGGKISPVKKEGFLKSV